MATVILKNVNKTFPGGIEAVRDFSMDIKDGEFVVLVGPSGCGKSTTLRMIAGLEEITNGDISIGERLVNDVPPKDRDIAMVFQNYALYPHMTVRENMAFGLKLRKYPKAEIKERIQEAAEILGLTELLDRRPKALSGGQRQRVAVGRAIVRKPAVFLFDEPLSNLDAKLRAQMRVEISRLHQKLGATMIYVTHDQVEAMTMGQRIVVMKDGFIQQVATPMELYKKPVNQFVAGFIGTPPMNFFRGRVLKKDNQFTFEAEDGFILPVSESAHSVLAAYVDKPVTVGIRPEDIGVRAGEQGAGFGQIPAIVDVIEPMGAESFVYLTAGTTAFVMRVKSTEGLTIGQSFEPTVQSNKLLFFDTTAGKVL